MKKPRPRLWRDIVVSLVAPLAFSFRTGHFRSSITGLACDSAGAPLPWLTYPAINFLQRLDLSDARILEFGGGQSTRWFASRAKSITTIEDDVAWADALAGTVGTNVTIVRSPPQPIRPDGVFDLVLIDGLDRFAAAQIAVECVAGDGLVILDNSEGNWGAAGTFPIIDLFREAGFMRVDFYGFAPANFRQYCTSIFFKPECRWIRGEKPPHF